jgi:hypothetical protein
MIPERLIVSATPSDNDLFMLLVGRIEAAESRRAGSSHTLLVDTIGFTAGRATLLVSRLQVSLARHRAGQAAFRRDQCMALRARPVGKAELANFLRALEDSVETGLSRLVTGLLADFSGEERAMLWRWVLGHDPASVSKRRIDVAALEKDSSIDALAVLESVCPRRPRISSETTILDVTDS